MTPPQGGRIRRGRGAAAPAGGDKQRVLLGLDGSDDSRRALSTALQLLSPHCGLPVLAELVAYDAADESRVEVDAAAARLAELAAGLDTPAEVHTQVLTGPPAGALRRLAKDQEIDLLVVGRRSRGISTRLLGRIFTELVEHSQPPVLVCEPSGDRT